MIKNSNWVLNLFFFFEKTNIFFFLNQSLKKNSATLLLPAHALLSTSVILKKELFFSSSQLLEASALDLSQFSSLSASFGQMKMRFKYALFYNFYFFMLKKRVHFFFFLDRTLLSMDSMYLNANWLERELSEMYGLFFFKKQDNRNLLLDYSWMEHPMLKSYANVGYKEVYYNILTRACQYKAINATEL